MVILKAVIALLLCARLTCPRTSRLDSADAQTLGMAPSPVALSKQRRNFLPSKARTCPKDLPYGMSLQSLCPGAKAGQDGWGSRPAKTRPKVSWEATPFGASIPVCLCARFLWRPRSAPAPKG